MKHCTAKTRQWPDASADVSPDEMDDFLAHAETCPYHEELLRMEDEEFDSVFLLARGLDGDGRILRGAELRNAITEHEQRAQEWEAVGSAESPFGLISLYNGGRLIACCGEFLDFTDHQALHDLDPRVGLQIRARCSSDKDAEVLLGFYPLAGRRHDGQERLFPLDNGYTIGLKAEKVSDRNFRIKFRCVEKEVIENESAVRAATPRGKARRANAAGSSFGHPSLGSHVPAGLRSRRWMPSAGSWQRRALSVTSAALALLLVMTSGGILLIKRWPDTAKMFAQSVALNSDAPGGGKAQQQSRDAPGTNPAANTVTLEFTQTAPENPVRVETVSHNTPAQVPPVSFKKTARVENALLANGLPPDTNKALSAEKNDDAPEVLIIDRWVIKSRKQKAGVDIDVEHFGADPALEEEVRKALEIRNLKEVAEFTNSSARKINYKTSWKIIRPHGDGVGQSLIEVEVHTSSDESNGLEEYRRKIPVPGSGGRLDYETAVNKAVGDVYDYVEGSSKPPQAGVEVVNQVAPYPIPTAEPPKGGAMVDLDGTPQCGGDR